VSDSHPDWIDKVAKLAGRIGMNPTQVRWKLIRWHDRRNRDRNRLAQKVDHIKYEHKTCDECGAVQDRDAKKCTACGARVSSRSVQMLRRFGILMPEAISLSTVLALILMATFARVWVAQGGGLAAPKPGLLLDFGAFWYRGRPDEYWRALTAMFLHIGFWHIAFNLLAIATVGPQIEQIWGRMNLLFIFIVTGIAGFVVSALAQPDTLTAGASGGVCGLIGAAAGWGQRLGTNRGRLIRNDMIKWFVYTIVFGFAVHANNWAHAGGAAAGFIFGYAMPTSLWKRSFAIRSIAKTIGVAGTVAAVAIIMTRRPTPPPPSQQSVSIAMIDFQAQVCRVAKVDPAGAKALVDIMLPQWGFPPESPEVLCATLITALHECRDGLAIEGMAPNDRHAYCDPIERALSDF